MSNENGMKDKEAAFREFRNEIGMTLCVEGLRECLHKLPTKPHTHSKDCSTTNCQIMEQQATAVFRYSLDLIAIYILGALPKTLEDKAKKLVTGIIRELGNLRKGGN